MNELTIKIREDGTVTVEDCVNGIKSYKAIAPDALLECINKSILRGSVSSGLLPRGCVSFAAYDNGSKDVCILHPEDRTDIAYFGTLFPNFPLPKLVFGFRITAEGRISQCRMGIVADESNLRPSTPMYSYPFSNVSGFNICVGNNSMPRCQSLHQLTGLPYHILSLDNNNDHFRPQNNKPGLEMRDLLTLLQDKSRAFYYTDILVPGKATLSDFISTIG